MAATEGQWPEDDNAEPTNTNAVSTSPEGIIVSNPLAQAPVTLVAVVGDPAAVSIALAAFQMVIPPVWLSPIAEYAIRLAIAGQPPEPQAVRSQDR